MQVMNATEPTSLARWMLCCLINAHVMRAARRQEIGLSGRLISQKRKQRRPTDGESAVSRSCTFSKLMSDRLTQKSHDLLTIFERCCCCCCTHIAMTKCLRSYRGADNDELLTALSRDLIYWVSTGNVERFEMAREGKIRALLSNG
jgi:hypothetical protein